MWVKNKIHCDKCKREIKKFQYLVIHGSTPYNYHKECKPKECVNFTILNKTLLP